MARNASIHAAGVVISPTPLKELVPLYKTNKDEIVTQYDMNGLEKLGLLKMDFLGLTTLTIIDDALKLIEKHRGVELDRRRYPARRPEDLRGLHQGLHQRHLPVRIAAACATSCVRYQPDAHRRPLRAERPLPPRPDPGRHDRRLHRPQARPQEGRLRSAGAEGNPRRNLRRHRLPGTGDADRQPPRRLLARRSRPAAPRHGQEEGRGDGEAARALHQRRAGARTIHRRRSRRSST